MGRIYTSKSSIHMSDTDMTGAVFFTHLLRLGLEAFENFLKSERLSLNALLQGSFFLPVVRSEGDFYAPLQVGDDLELALTLQNMGTSSFRLQTKIYKMPEYLLAGATETVHVAVDKKSKRPTPLPAGLRELLQRCACQTG